MLFCGIKWDLKHGGQLTLKKGRYGEFYGCSSYPKCNHKMKLSRNFL
ncbi:MAG: topoisomerase DNA-binding C4 zinc finger domain-containing protein [Solibacillus sp.]